MAGLTAPTARRRRLGLELRRLREAADLKIGQVATQVGLSSSQLSRIETGKQLCRTAYLTTMLDMYGVTDPKQIQLLKDMAREGQRKGWWADYDDELTEDFGIYVGLESEAASVRAYEAQLVHGLLQTRDYARALFRAWDPKASAEHIDRQTELRIKRQEVLARPGGPLELWAVLDEAALRRQVGGPGLMRLQLDHLLDLGGLPNVAIQVLPFGAGAHPAMGRPFVILAFPERADPDVVYLEDLTSALYVENVDEVDRYNVFFNHLRATALSFEDSATLITSVLKAL